MSLNNWLNKTSSVTLPLLFLFFSFLFAVEITPACMSMHETWRRHYSTQQHQGKSQRKIQRISQSNLQLIFHQIKFVAQFTYINLLVVNYPAFLLFIAVIHGHLELPFVILQFILNSFVVLLWYCVCGEIYVLSCCGTLRNCDYYTGIFPPFFVALCDILFVVIT